MANVAEIKDNGNRIEIAGLPVENMQSIFNNDGVRIENGAGRIENDGAHFVLKGRTAPADGIFRLN